jgi:hypothetical protein
MGTDTIVDAHQSMYNYLNDEVEQIVVCAGQ